MLQDYQIAYVDENDGNRIKFGFGAAHKKASPAASLVQRVLKLMFTRVGSHVFTPSAGSLFADIVGGHFSKDDQSSIIAFIGVGVADVEQSIKKEQSEESDLLPEETLESLKLLDVAPLGIDSWALEMIIYTKSGAAYIAKVENS